MEVKRKDIKYTVWLKRNKLHPSLLKKCTMYSFKTCIEVVLDLTTMCSVSFQSYKSAGTGDLRLVFVLMTIAAIPVVAWSKFKRWQLACVCDVCRVPGSCDHSVRPSQPTSDKQNQWEKPDLFNDPTIHLTTAVILLNTCGKENCKTGCESLGKPLA